MNLIKKTLAASVVSLGLASGSAFAAIDGDDLPLGANQFDFVNPTGTGEVFISVVARDAGNPANDNSIVIDTGVLSSDFINLAVGTPLVIAPDANMATFIANNAGLDLSFNVMGVHNPAGFNGLTGGTVGVGMLTTSSVDGGTVAATQPRLTTDFTSSGGSGKVNNIIRNANIATDGDPVGNVAVNASSLHTSGSLAFHDATIGGNGVFGFDTEGGVGLPNSVDFYFLTMNTVDQPLEPYLAPQLLGVWDLALDGTLTFTAVPIPGAVWLLGSAMIGVAGVARRRKA